MDWTHYLIYEFKDYDEDADFIKYKYNYIIIIAWQ